ncbi:hypothetical protein BDR03DRAFT_969411 [Suillus americanus]|nr:hypothetical protein BDR03DRAFT_969411 [Suillus americanus]
MNLVSRGRVRLELDEIRSCNLMMTRRTSTGTTLPLLSSSRRKISRDVKLAADRLHERDLLSFHDTLDSCVNYQPSTEICGLCGSM